jgi:hypothetical protein
VAADGVAQAAASAAINMTSIHFRNILHQPAFCDKNLARRCSAPDQEAARARLYMCLKLRRVNDRPSHVKHKPPLACYTARMQPIFGSGLTNDQHLRVWYWD